jgi:MFS family permease
MGTLANKFAPKGAAAPQSPPMRAGTNGHRNLVREGGLRGRRPLGAALAASLTRAHLRGRVASDKSSFARCGLEKNPLVKEPLTAARPVSLWRNRDYLLLWLGEAGISSLGTGISQLAFPLLILAMTHSPAAAGFAGALQQVPPLLFNLPAGALTDRWDRRRVMLVCTVGLLLCIGSVPLALAIGRLTLAQIYVVAFGVGSFATFSRLAETGALAHLIPKEQMPTAVAQDEAAYSTVSLLAPSLSGWLFSIRQLLPFLADAVSYVVLLGALLLIRRPLQGERSAEPPRLLREVRVGIGWLWAHHLLRLLAFLAGYLELLLTGSVLIVLVIAQQRGISSALVGVILAVGGFGNLAGAGIGARLQRRMRFGRALRVVLLGFVLAWPLYGFAATPLALGAVVVVWSMVDSTAVVQIVSYRLTAVPEDLQGRVGSTYRLIVFGVVALGQLAIGLCLQQFGVLATVAFLWAGLLLFALLALLRRQLDQPGDAGGFSRRPPRQPISTSP